MAMIWYEIKKVLTRPSSQLALLAMLLLMVQSCLQAAQSKALFWAEEDGTILGDYAAIQKVRSAQHQWAGIVDEAYLTRALEELKRINSEPGDPEQDTITQDDVRYSKKLKLQMARDMLIQFCKSSYDYHYEDYFLPEKLEPEQLQNFYEKRIQQLQETLYNPTTSAYSLFSDVEKEYYLALYRQLDTPFYVDYYQGWEGAFEATHRFFVWGCILTAFLLSGLFAGEFRWKADSVYFSTPHGRKRGTIAKLAAGFLITTVIFWVATLILNLAMLCYMGFEGGDCPIQLRLYNSPYNVTFFQRQVWNAVYGYLGWMFSAAVVMLVSAQFRSLSLATAMPALMMLFPQFIDRNVQDVERSLLLRLSPLKMLEVFTNQPVVMCTVFGKAYLPIEIQRVVYPILTVLLAVLCYRTFCRRQIR